MGEKVIVTATYAKYTKKDLMEMDPVVLGALLRERTHHMIEVPLYPTLLKESGKPKSNFGIQAQNVFEVWRERGFPEDTPDLKWVKKYLGIAEKIRAGEKVKLEIPVPKPFTEEEMKVVRRLIYDRCSIRDWIDKEVPDDMINEILEAGRAAPIGCNLDEIRFIVLKPPKETKMIWSDISTENAVIIVVCHDKRAIGVVGQDRLVPHNAGFDASAAADHMLLMAHALGLGGVWLSSIKKADGSKNTANDFKELYGLPEYIEVHLHIAVGWTAMGTIKSARIPLEDMIIKRDKNK